MPTHFIAASRKTAAPPSAVWSLLADVGSWPTTIAPYLSHTSLEGPLAVGTMGRVKTRFWPLASSWMVIDVEEGHRWSWTGKVVWATVTYHHIVEPADRGSRVVFSIDVDDPGPDYVGRWLRRANLRQMNTALDRMVDLVESRAG